MTQARIGLTGLGTMGAAVTRRFHAEAGDLADRVIPTESLAELVAAIAPPRAIILMVPAGPAVDEQIAASLRSLKLNLR